MRGVELEHHHAWCIPELNPLVKKVLLDSWQQLSLAYTVQTLASDGFHHPSACRTKGTSAQCSISIDQRSSQHSSLSETRVPKQMVTTFQQAIR